MTSLKRAFLAALLLFPLVPAAAQDQPGEQDADEMVVEGRRFEEQVRDFVDALTPARPHETVARFQESVCPAVRGLSPSQNEAVLTRLRAVGEAVGVRIEPLGCTVNSLLVVTEDKGRFIRALASTRPWFFGDLTALQIRRRARSPGPSAAWQLKGLISADGHPIYFDAGSGYYINRTTQAASRGRPTANWHFEGTALVVERAALEGLDATQLADFAAMRLYARTDPTRITRSGAPSILGILEAPMGSPVPVTMTSWDFAFLRGLYASPANRFSGTQRSLIRDDMRDALRPPPEEE